MVALNPSSIEAANLIGIIVDGRFPTPASGIGPGQFNLGSNANSTSSLSSDNDIPIFIYTARQAQNHLVGNVTINGSPYLPGVHLIDDPQNEYALYALNGVGLTVFPYTIFYKEGLPIPVPPTHSTSFQNVIAFELAIFETAFQLNNNSEDFYWEPAFGTSYNMASMKNLPRHVGSLTSYDVRPDEKFFEFRKKYLYYKGYTP